MGKIKIGDLVEVKRKSFIHTFKIGSYATVARVYDENDVYEIGCEKHTDVRIHAICRGNGDWLCDDEFEVVDWYSDDFNKYRYFIVFTENGPVPQKTGQNNFIDFSKIKGVVYGFNEVEEFDFRYFIATLNNYER
jgi:hypothetical protein